MRGEQPGYIGADSRRLHRAGRGHSSASLATLHLASASRPHLHFLSQPTFSAIALTKSADALQEGFHKTHCAEAGVSMQEPQAPFSGSRRHLQSFSMALHEKTDSNTECGTPPSRMKSNPWSVSIKNRIRRARAAGNFFDCSQVSQVYLLTRSDTRGQPQN